MRVPRLWNPRGLLSVVALFSAFAALSFGIFKWHQPKPRDMRTNYSCIENGLYLGGILEQPPPGIRAVLNVSEEDDSSKPEVYRWDPISDVDKGPTLEWLKRHVQ